MASTNIIYSTYRHIGTAENLHCFPSLLFPRVCKLPQGFIAQARTHPLCFNSVKCVTLPDICNVFQIRTGVHQCWELTPPLHLSLLVFLWTSPAQSQQSHTPVTEIHEGETRMTDEVARIKTLIQCGEKSVTDLLRMSDWADFWGWTTRDALVVRSGDLQKIQEPLAFFILLWPLDVEGCRGEGLQRPTHVTDLNSKQ